MHVCIGVVICLKVLTKVVIYFIYIVTFKKTEYTKIGIAYYETLLDLQMPIACKRNILCTSPNTFTLQTIDEIFHRLSTNHVKLCTSIIDNSDSDTDKIEKQ